MVAGGGAQTRTFSISQVAINGGSDCLTQIGAIEEQSCNTDACPVDCVGAWSAFGACSVSCGGGTQEQTYSVSTPAANSGSACPAADGAVLERACDTNPCDVVVDCVGQWGDWSSCSATCGA